MLWSDVVIIQDHMCPILPDTDYGKRLGWIGHVIKIESGRYFVKFNHDGVVLDYTINYLKEIL